MVLKKISVAKNAPEPFRVGDEVGARMKKNSNNRAYSLGTYFIVDMSLRAYTGYRKKLPMSKSLRNPSV